MNHASAYRDVIEQFVNEASFLWLLRSIALDQPHTTHADVAALEQRIDASLEGMMTSCNVGWESCEAALALGQPGEQFTATVFALRHHEMRYIQTVVETGLSNAHATPGLLSALGWLEPDLIQPWIGRFLGGKDLNHKYVGLAACSIRRDDPGEVLTSILNREDCLTHTKLHARALRLIGELRRVDLLPALHAAAFSSEPSIAFWANWSAILLGQYAAVKNLQPFVFHSGPYQARAIQIAFRILPMAHAQEWISTLAKDPVNLRAVITATGVLGDPHAVNWLLGKMADPLLVRLAAESFTNITGMDLVKHQLHTKPPERAAHLVEDDTDDTHLGLDDDANLPWPNVEKVATQWRHHSKNFQAGQRYFLGKPITAEWLKNTMTAGDNMRHCHAAALALALIDPQQRFINTYAKVTSLGSGGARRDQHALTADPSSLQGDAMRDQPKVYIAGVGMITAIGADAPMTAAAVRTGISGYKFSDFALQSHERVRMALVPESVFETSLNTKIKIRRLGARQVRLLQLATVALAQLQPHLPPKIKLPVFIAGPEPRDEEAHALTPAWLENLARQTDVNVDIPMSRILSTGRAGGLAAIKLAFRLFDSTEATFALIGGVDTYYDNATLVKLVVEKRLLAGQNRDGFIPGEGAGFMLLAKHPLPLYKDSNKTVCLYEPGLGSEVGHRTSEQPYRGEGLAGVLAAALDNAQMGKIQTLYSSMNGEHFFAKELGVAVIRNSESLDKKMKTEHPADCFGDLGAAFGPVIVGITAINVVNNKIAAPCAVCCSSDRDQRSAVVMHS